MVGRCLDENEHVIDSNTGQGTQKSKDHLGKYQTSGMYPKVVVRACNKNFAQHILSYPPATNGAKRNLGRLRYSCQRAPEQSINTSWIHGILKFLVHPLWCPKLSPLGSPVPDYNRCIQLIDRIKNTTNSRNKRGFRSEIMLLGPQVTSISSNK